MISRSPWQFSRELMDNAAFSTSWPFFFHKSEEVMVGVLRSIDFGDFAVIGIDITDSARPNLPATAGCGSDERIVRIPRILLLSAKPDIPDNV